MLVSQGWVPVSSTCLLYSIPSLPHYLLQLEGELLSLKRLLTGGSPLLLPGNGAASEMALTPGSQLYYDADSGGH